MGNNIPPYVCNSLVNANFLTLLFTGSANPSKQILHSGTIFSKELSSYNITVNTIGPTPIETDLIRVVPKDKVEKILSDQTIKRFGKFSDISNVIDFFINDESSFITGQKIYLGGL